VLILVQEVGFAPGLQFPFNQGQYPLALGFKPLTDGLPMRLSVPPAAPAVTPPATIPGIPAPDFPQSEQTGPRSTDAGNSDSEESAPTHIQGGGDRDVFARTEQIDNTELSSPM
jgi:hypothetical protein